MAFFIVRVNKITQLVLLSLNYKTVFNESYFLGKYKLS
ncbi:hypothetical protein BACFRA24663_16825 [Bacteroides fragilis]